MSFVAMGLNSDDITPAVGFAIDQVNRLENSCLCRLYGPLHLTLSKIRTSPYWHRSIVVCSVPGDEANMVCRVEGILCGTSVRVVAVSVRH